MAASARLRVFGQPHPQVARRRFCAKPFQNLEVAQNGDVYLCCQGWLPVSVGNVWTDDISSIWNGPRAQELRRSILDDSFRHCTACPFLSTVTAPVHYADEVHDQDERVILDSGAVVAGDPRMLNLAYDRTCNLSCPSCRTELVVASGSRIAALSDMQGRLLQGDLLNRIEWLYVTGSGDPFASRLYRELLRSIEPERYPRLRVKLHTNALLFTAEAWSDLGAVRSRVGEVEVSVDAACAATYAMNRRGGRWETLLENLAFIASLRRDGPVGFLQLSFVVQANNWREMPAFVGLGERFAVDRVFFSALRNWNTFSHEEFLRRAVHLPDHPEHRDFAASLTDHRLRQHFVTLGELVQ
jgi:radical SAM protein with 4Fe4S-binding SPASM domain